MYLYHADALGLGGALVLPVRKEIPSQAACSLPTTGGVSSSRVDNFDHAGISFRRAETQVSGMQQGEGSDGVYRTTGSVVMEDLNILNMVMADKVVVKVSSSRRSDGSDPEIQISGHFENLKIDGHPIEVEESSADTLRRFDTFEVLQHGFRDANHREEILGSMMGCGVKIEPGDPPHLQDIYRGFQGQESLLELRGPAIFSLVKKIKPLSTLNVRTFGPVVVVPRFGTIYLGEVIVSHGSRRVNMLRLELGSERAGSLVAGSVESSGSIYPAPIVHAGRQTRANASNARYTALKTRYQSLIDRKYMSGLSPAENEELNRLERDLDELDEPYYENALRRVQEGTPS